MILGIDECGAGSWAGPLSVCGVLSPSPFPFYVDDSKRLTESKRKSIYNQLKNLTHTCLHIDSNDVDSKGLAAALTSAMQAVILSLPAAHTIIVDGSPKNLKILEHQKIIFLNKGDSLIPQISAASIIAKVEHDDIMLDLHKKYPNFNFASNKGYGTKDHSDALEKYPPTNCHRFSYKPIQKWKNYHDQHRLIESSK